MQGIDALGAPGYETTAIASLSDAGRVRAENQDALAVLENELRERLLIVADGMGGHRGGQTASRICLESVERVFREPNGAPEQRLRRSLELANEEIYTRALDDSELRGMGTTVVAALLAPDGRVWLAWVGDSRCYRLRDRALESLTRDHSLMTEWISLGVITSEAAKTHPRRHELMRALGQAPDVTVDLVEVDLRPGDRLLLCSDGLHGYVQERALGLALASGTPEQSALALVEAANAVGGADNVSVVVAAVPDSPADAPSAESEMSFADISTEIAEVVADPPGPADDAGPETAPSAVSEPVFQLPADQQIQIPRMTPVRARRALDPFSLLVGVFVTLGIVLAGFGLWTYTAKTGSIAESHAPKPSPALVRVRPPAPAPAAQPALPEAVKPVAKPVAKPVEKPVAKRAEKPVAKAEIAPAPEPTPIPAPAPARLEPPPEPSIPAAPAPEADGAAQSFSGFELTRPVESFLTDWLAALASGDPARLEALGFRDEPAEFAGTPDSRDGFRLVAAEIDEERSQEGRVYLRLIVSYAFRDANGRFRTQDEQRLILSEIDGRLRFEGRWRQ